MYARDRTQNCAEAEEKAASIACTALGSGAGMAAELARSR
jgi:hypothetical protein